MKKILGLIFVCLLMTDLARCQEGGKTNAKGLGRLDSVSTTEEVEEIITSVDKRYASFRVNTALDFEEDNCFRLTDLSKIKTVSKADFNRDRYTDLLVTGMWGKTPTILVAMGSHDNKISVQLITNRAFRKCSIAKIVLEDDNTLIEHRYFKTYNAFAPETAMIDSAKLVFRFGGFVEYNPSPKPYNIEQIEYKTEGGAWTPSSGFSIIIQASGKAKYSTEALDDFRGSVVNTYSSVLRDSIYNEIAGLINYSDFTNLKDRYAVRWTDDHSSRLKITYDGGKVKIISDYGRLGTHGLSRIYEIISSLRASQTWMQVPSQHLMPLIPFPGVN